MPGSQQDFHGNHGLVIGNAGRVTMTNVIAGPHGTLNVGSAVPNQPPAVNTGRYDVGVITILSEETAPVIAMLRRGAGYAKAHLPGTQRRVHEALISAEGRDVRVVAIQTADRGQRSAALAYRELCDTYSPSVVVLLGIAGGIHKSLALGDVVVAEEVCYYDARRVSAGRSDAIRGQNHAITAGVRHALNDFFSEQGEPSPLSMPDPAELTRTYYVRRGPVGSGEAVIADSQSSILEYLRGFNDKILAIDTETGGVAQAWYETPDPKPGWLAIRGISDRADLSKDDAFHEVASVNAVAVLERMLRYLIPDLS